MEEELRFDLFSKVDYFIHLAASAHFVSPFRQSPSSESILMMNTNLLVQYFPYFNLSRLHRLIFVSSLSVLTDPKSTVITSASIPAPNNPHAHSKLACESLLKNCSSTNTEYVIFRPTLIYGPNAPGNFKLFSKLIRFLPFYIFSSLHNPRSFLSIHNFVSAIEVAISTQNPPMILFYLRYE